MRFSSRIITAVTLLAGSLQPALAAAPRPGPGSAPTVALQSLPQLAAENPSALGFRTVAEASTATATDPIPVYLLRLDRLKAYRAGQDPMTLLTDLNAALYLLQVGRETRSSMELALVRGVWEPRSFGDVLFAKQLDQVRTQVAAAEGVDPSAFFAVRAAALNLSLLAYQGPRGLMFVPLVDEASLKFQAGVPQTAAQALAVLQPVAAEHDGRAH